MNSRFAFAIIACFTLWSLLGISNLNYSLDVHTSPSGYPISTKYNSLEPVIKHKFLESFLAPLFFSHPSSNLPASPAASNFINYLVSDCFISLSRLPHKSKVIILHLDYCNRLLTILHASTFICFPWSILRSPTTESLKAYIISGHSSVQNLLMASYPFKLNFKSLIMAHKVLHNLAGNIWHLSDFISTLQCISSYLVSLFFL